MDCPFENFIFHEVSFLSLRVSLPKLFASPEPRNVKIIPLLVFTILPLNSYYIEFHLSVYLSLSSASLRLS